MAIIAEFVCYNLLIFFMQIAIQECELCLKNRDFQGPLIECIYVFK